MFTWQLNVLVGYVEEVGGEGGSKFDTVEKQSSQSTY